MRAVFSCSCCPVSATRRRSPSPTVFARSERFRSRLSAGQGPREWLAKIFPEGCTISGEVTARFFCGCSMERVERALKLLGLEEIRAVLEDRRDGSSDVICGFCRMAYTLQPARLRALITEVESESPECGMRN